MDTNPKYMRLPYVPSFWLQIPETVSAEGSMRLARVLGSLAHLFCQVIPEVGNRTLTIIIDPERKEPVCFRGQKQIYLNSEPQYWCQAAYQFGHELCHYAIPAAVHPKLKWLEETICEVSSLYFLHRMAVFWHETGVHYRTDTGDLYADFFSKYGEDAAQDEVPFDFTNPAEIASLEADCYQRGKNRHIANKLLPVFNAHPDLWSAVPILCQVQDAGSFQASLDNWLELSPHESHSGLLAVNDLFARK